MHNDIKKPTLKHLPRTTIEVKNEGVTMGLFLMFAAVSITWSTYYVIAGTKGWVNIVMVAPQAALAAYIAVRKFTNK